MADSIPDEGFYKSCVTEKIQQCEQKTKLVSSRGENTRRSGQAAADKVEFYRAHSEELAQAMLNDNIGNKPYKVRYYLIKAYNDSTRFGENKLADNQ